MSLKLPRGAPSGTLLDITRQPMAALLEEAEEDLLAFYGFPAEHRAKLRSTNPLERVNHEIGRRTDVVSIFPNDRALLRLAASVVIEQSDEWLVGRRYLSLDSAAAGPPPNIANRPGRGLERTPPCQAPRRPGPRLSSVRRSFDAQLAVLTRASS